MPVPSTTRVNYQQRALRAAKQRASQLDYQLVPMSDAPGVPPNTAAVH